MDQGDQAASGVTTQGIEARLRAALRDAIKIRDVVAAFALRAALGAISNAEAVPAEEAEPADPEDQAGPRPVTASPASSPYVAHAAAGVGAADVARRRLGPARVREIVQAEISEREITAAQYAGAGHGDRAARLGREAQILRAVMEG